jgi:HEAT repeat protein
MDGQVAASLANDWLKDFCLALRNIGLYSPEHPRGRESVDRAYERLRRMLDERGEIVLARSESRIFLGEHILDRDRLLSRQVVDTLSARGIDSISFLPEITCADHLGLLRCLLLAPDKIQERGGFDQVLEDEGVQSVQVDRARFVRASSDADSLRQAALVDLLTRLRATPPGAPAGPEGTSTATAVFSGDPDDLGRALESAAREARQAGNVATLAGFVAGTLEALAGRAIDERDRGRQEILEDIGRAVIGCAPETQVLLFSEHAGPRSAHRHVAEAIEALAPAAVGDLMALHYPRVHGDYRPLARMLNRTSAWRGRRADALAAAEREFARLGVGAEEYRELVTRLLWTEMDDDRRLALLHRNDYLWRADSAHVEIALTSLLDAGRTEDASRLVDKLLQGLASPDAAVRRRVAGDVPGVVRVVETAGKGNEALRGIPRALLDRLVDERDEEVAARMAAGLASVAAASVREGEFGAALEIMREADRLGAARDPAASARGKLLAAALAGSIDAAARGRLLDAAIEGTCTGAADAVEILSKTCVRHVLEALAQEDHRPRRARLINLLKDMARRTWLPFVGALDDPRWYLVRNVVSILGEVADESVLPELFRVASHEDARVRKEAVRAISRFGKPECERKILAALEDDNPRVQIAAVPALSGFPGSGGASGVLTKLCERSQPYDAAPLGVRQEAILGLARSGSPEAYQVLAKLLGRKGILGRTEPTEVRVTAARALGSVGTAEATALLTDLARKDPRERVREAAALALQHREG